MKMGTLLIVLGLGISLGGALLLIFLSAFSWFGKLPGDIRIEGGGYFVLVPITSLLIISVILSLLLKLLAR
jgi:hypothetical protein